MRDATAGIIRKIRDGGVAILMIEHLMHAIMALSDRVSALNPNSHYHLSLRLDYPNAFDQAHAQDDRRTFLGGDIMIHGLKPGADHPESDWTQGCIAVTDSEMDEIWRMVADGTPIEFSGMAAYETARLRELRLRPWLASIAVNLARNRRRRHADRYPPAAFQPLTDAGFDPRDDGTADPPTAALRRGRRPATASCN